MKKLLGWPGAAFLIAAVHAPLLAQVNAARVDGMISDAQGLAVPRVRVVLTEVKTKLSRVVETSSEGAYQFVGLNPGTYELVASAKGFAPATPQLTLEVNQSVRLDLTLAVGELSQTVEVVGSSELLRTGDASLGEVIEPKMTQELPLNGRHLLDLAMLAPSVHAGSGAATGSTNPLYWRPQQDSALSVGGARPNANYFLLDGATDTDPTFNTLALSPSPDAVQEFKVQTGSYSAEFGGAGGAQINIVTQSGSNKVHGDVYEFLRNSVFDARAFNVPDNTPHLSQNQFGASLGGPIQKNQTFYFANYEGFRLSNIMTNTETVPTLRERAGDFSQSSAMIYDPSTTHPNPNYDPSKPVSPTNPAVLRDAFSGNVITSPLSPVALTVLSLLPPPNLGPGAAMGIGMGMGGGSDSNNYLDQRRNLNSSDQGTFRVDRNLRGGDALFARYSILSERDFTPQNLPGFGAFDNNVAQNLTVSYTHILSALSVNTAWFGMSRLSMHRYSQNNFTNDYITQLGIQGVGYGGKGAWGMPWFALQGYDGIGDSFAATPVQDWDTVFQGQNIWSRQLGRNSLKAGGDYRRFFWPMWGFFQNRGYYQFTNGFTTQTATNDGTGSALASFLLGLPVVKQRQAGIPDMDLRQWYGDAFIEDDWRVSDRTTLNLGVRYEYMSALYDVRSYKRGSNLVFMNGVPAIFIGGEAGMPNGLMYPNAFDFAPRLGLTHAVGGKYGFVMRAAFGTFFTPVDMNTWCNQRHNIPFVFPETQQSDNFITSLSGFNFGSPVLGQTRVSFAAFDPHSQPQYVNQWSLSLQKALPGNTVVELGYQGARGYHLQRAHLINNAPPGPGPINPRRPYKTLSFVPGTLIPSGVAVVSDVSPVSAINLLEDSARSWYDAGWVDVRRRYQHGLTLLSNFTWAKSLTNSPDFRSPMDESAIPQNNSLLDAEKGLACDLRRRFVASLVYELPGWKTRPAFARLTSNWQLATVYQAQSGFPFTVSVFGDTANAGTLLGENPIRANVTGQPMFPAGTRTTAAWFNPSAFATPPAFQFGTAGRNTVEGPGLQLMDVSLTREFRLTEGLHLQMRGEMFNALNHSNYMTPNRFVNTPQFGTITMASTPGREVQLSGRIVF